MTYGLYRAAGSGWSLCDVYTDDPTLDNGPLWFVEALLIFSLAYAAWAALWLRRPPRADASEPLLARHLLLLGGGIAIATFVVRPWFPFDSIQVSNAHVWQWPECIGLFGLGIVSARRGWLQPVPTRIRRGRGLVPMIATAILITVFASSQDPDASVEAFGGGWRWEAFVLATIGGAMSVCASIWGQAFFQRHVGRAGRTARATGRAAYAAFMLQGFPLVAAALVLRPLDVPLEIKSLLVAVSAIAGSFALGWLLVTRTRLVRIL